MSAVNRDTGIETLRTIALFWIVLAHVAGISPGGGLGYSETAVMQYLQHTVTFFPIPVFAMLAGYVYAYRPLAAENTLSFVRKKFIRVALPALGVALLMLVLQAIVPGALTEVSLDYALHYLLYPQTHVWFLYSLFWVFVFGGLLDLFSCLSTTRRWLIATVIAVLIELCLPTPTRLLALNTVNYLLPFFLMGYGLNRFAGHWQRLPLLAFLVPGLALLGLQQYLWFAEYDLSVQQLRVLDRSLSWSLLPLVFLYRPSIPVLAWFGPLTFIIYLFHPLCAAAARIVLEALIELHNPVVLVIVVYVISVVGSLALFQVGRWIISIVMRQAGKPSLSVSAAPHEHEARS